MTDIFDAMDALLGQFSGVDGLTCTLGPIVNNIGTPPALIVDTEDGDFLNYQIVQGGGVVDAQLVVTVFAQAEDPKSAREELRPYLADSGAKSVYATVAADPTLGGVVTSAAVLTARNMGRYTIGAQERRYLGVEFPVEVML